jgi:hypothetical protein
MVYSKTEVLAGGAGAVTYALARGPKSRCTRRRDCSSPAPSSKPCCQAPVEVPEIALATSSRRNRSSWGKVCLAQSIPDNCAGVGRGRAQ